MPVASDFLRDAWLQWAYLDTTLPTRPTTRYLALFTDAGAEVTGTEDANYARQAITFETFSTPGRVRNAASVSMPAAETGASYKVAEFAVFDAQTGGNRLQRDDLEFTKDVAGGDVLTFAAGDLIMGVDPL